MNHDPGHLRQLVRIGTARTGSQPPGVAAPFDTLLPASNAAVPEAHLWMALGALDLWERSGHVPAAAGPTMADAAPAENLPACPPAAEGLLALLLRGVHPATLLPQWLRGLRGRGARLPERFLPKLLDLATQQALLRPAVLAVLGERGRWLAGLHADWAWATERDGIEQAIAAWDAGTLAQRVAGLRTWRRHQRDVARQALADAWNTEGPEQRAALLSALDEGLAPADEAFLEAALDDRRKEVRVTAQRLLARLPGSALAQRMRARLLPILKLERPLLRPRRLELDLPAANDPAAQRDGAGGAAHPGLGEKAGWVVDMLAAVDPQAWSQHFGMAPRALLDAAAKGESGAALVRGWALALQRQAATGVAPGLRDWLGDLALWWIGADAALRKAIPIDLFDACTGNEAILAAVLDALPPGWAADAELVGLVQRLADHAPGAWPQAASRRALRQVSAALPAFAAQSYAWLPRQLLGSLALAVDPAEAAGMEPAWRAALSDDTWRAPLDQFFDTVRIRHEMTLSFQEPA